MDADADTTTITLLLISMLASMLSFAPTTIIVFRRWFRGAHLVSHRANAFSLAALAAFQLVLFAPRIGEWLDVQDSPGMTLMLGALPAGVVCALNLMAWRTWLNFIRAESQARAQQMASEARE